MNKLTLIGSVDDAMLSSVLEALKSASKREPLDVLLCSEGGQAEIGLAIAASLRAHDSGYRVHVIGYAHSAAVAIVAAASYRSADSMATLMYHASSLKLKGNAIGVIDEARHHLRDERRWASFLAKYTKLNEKQWLKVATKDTYFTAAEALNIGLIDEVREVL